MLNEVIRSVQLAFNCISYYYRYINYFEKHVAYLISSYHDLNRIQMDCEWNKIHIYINLIPFFSDNIELCWEL